MSVPEAVPERQRGGRWWTAGLAVLAILAALVLPNRLAGFAERDFATAPVEFAAIVAVLGLAGGWLAGPVAVVVGLGLALLVVLKLADMGSLAAIGRPFDPVLDLHLLSSIDHLLRGILGPTAATAAMAAAAVGVVLLAVLLVLAALRLGRAIRSRGAAAGAAIAGLAGLAGLGAVLAAPPHTGWRSATLLRDHATGAVASWHDLRAFQGEMVRDPSAAIPADRLLTALRGKDVLIAFVESYGRSAVEDPRYAPEIRAILGNGSDALAAAGLGVRTGFLTSTTVGGMSWLAHGTLLSGLRIDSQRRYDALVASPRVSLNALFKRAGWRTVALVPAITMDWPESRWFGYDTVYPAAGLGYRGQPFNWITMPDQFVYSQLERLERDKADRPPIMAEMALVSSHAPWTPVPDLVPWDAVGDGTVFNDQATAGDPPDVVWRDPDRVRLQYRLATGYALQALTAYASRFAGDRLVIIALGDHQPAPLVTGDDASRDVPIHVITRDQGVLDAFAAWGWSEGLVPPLGAPAMPMGDFRDRFVKTFSTP